MSRSVARLPAMAGVSRRPLAQSLLGVVHKRRPQKTTPFPTPCPQASEQKPPTTKPFRQKTPGQNPCERLIEFVQGAFVRVLCTRTTKNRGGPRCVTYFRGGVPGCVTKCDRGRGSKLAKNSVTYFMDGPLWVRLE